MLPDRVWPIRVRPGKFETVESFLRRLRAANLVTDLAWGAWVKPTVRAIGEPRRESLHLIAEVSGDLQPGHFARDHAALPTHKDGTTCANCLTGLLERFGCVRCSGGERVEQHAHDGPRVCRRHMWWIGPGSEPEEQYAVGVDVLRADRLYRRLRRQGLIDAHRLAEILACVEDWAGTEGVSVDAGSRFRIATLLAHRVFRPRLLDVYSDHRIDAADRYAKLVDVISELTGTDACVVLTDAIWLLVRAAGHQVRSTPHMFVCTTKAENLDERAELEQLRSSAYPRARHLHISMYVSSGWPGTRFERYRQMSKKNDYVCARGHSFPQTLSVLRNAKTSVGCGVCSNKRLLRGFNSLFDTHPDLALEWHPTMNGDMSPHDVTANSEDEVFWLCPEGHDYELSPTRRRKGTGCYYCSNKRVHGDINAFSRTHPAIAAEWHPTRNGGLTPADFVAGSIHEAWWHCSAGHDYPMKITNRCISGHSCIYCGRQKVHPSTCFAVTHPEAAARWHPSRNGSLTAADVLSGTRHKVWWLCKEKNHYYWATVASQSKSISCNICTGRVVDVQNCMRTTRPDLARQFHPTENGALTPDNVLASTGETIVWLCENGHDWPATGHNRVAGTGCPYCSNFSVWVGWNDMATTRPDLAAEWDWDNNGVLTPRDVVAGTNKRIAWICADGHRWPAKGNERVAGSGCPECYKRRRRRPRVVAC